MINEIQIYNVEFGDCFVCKDNSSKMLVDFGSHHQSNISPRVIQNLNTSLLAAEKKYLMVTHFHNDHMNGIPYLRNSVKFDEVYLPNFFYRSVIKLQFAALLYLGKRSRAGAFALRLLNLIPNIVSHLSNTSQIRFVKRGETIVNSLDACRVLWPNSDCFEEKANKLYGELIRQLESYVYGETNNARRDRRISEFQHIHEQIESVGNGYYNLLRRHMEAGIVTGGRYLSDLKPYVDITGNATSEFSNVPDNELRREISDFQNEICVCFDNNNEGKEILFLSDITIDNFQELLALSNHDGIKLHETYNTIKVAHHGTKAHFVPNLPLSKKLMISNGVATNNNSWYITALYAYHYSNREFYCTNYKTCDYSLTNQVCPARCNCARNNMYVNYTLIL